MRKLIRTVIIVVGVIVVVVIAVGIYAVLNLNGIIQKQRGLILSKASDAVGRKVDSPGHPREPRMGCDRRPSRRHDRRRPEFLPAAIRAGRRRVCAGRADAAAEPSRRNQAGVAQAARRAHHPQPARRVERKLDREEARRPARPRHQRRPRRPRPGCRRSRARRLPGAAPGQTPAGAGALGEVSVSSLTVEDATIVYQDAGARAGHGERGRPGRRESRRQHADRHQAEPGGAWHGQKSLADRQGRTVDDQRRDRS